MKLKETFFVICCCLFGLLLSGPVPARAAGVVRLDILYLNHGPLRPTIRKLHALIDQYPGKVQTHWLDADKSDGRAFEKEHGIHGHVPLLILVDGRKDFVVSGKSVVFEGFPSGSGPFKEVEGNWSLADLQHLLNDLTR